MVILSTPKIKQKHFYLFLTIFLSILFFNGRNVLAFCGFFVAKVDAEMFNNRSEVAIANQGNNTTYSLAFDYKGNPEEFALVLRRRFESLKAVSF